MKEILINLASLLQAAKLQNHNFHNVCSRVAFFADHDAFKDLYEAYDSHYDDVVERCIGMHGVEGISLQVQLPLIIQRLSSIQPAADNTGMFTQSLQLDVEIQNMVEQICKLPEIRESEKQLLGELSNQCAMRQYKIKQRIRK